MQPSYDGLLVPGAFLLTIWDGLYKQSCPICVYFLSFPFFVLFHYLGLSV